MNFRERVILYYLIGAIILSRILVIVLTWFRTFVTTLLITFLIAMFSRIKRDKSKNLPTSHCSTVNSPHEPSGASRPQYTPTDQMVHALALPT